jgi:hypothetical protein
MEPVMSKSPSQTSKLSDSQRVILSAAAQRADGSLLPFPQSVIAKGAAIDKVVETLRKRKLIEERKVINGAPEWRQDEDRQPFGLFITNSGLLALGVDRTENTKPSRARASMTRQRKTGTAKSRGKAPKASPAKPKKRGTASQSKQDVVVQMLRQRSGVTIDEIIAETSWQPHSVRGFFSGLVKKKLKLPLTSEVGKDGVRRYHIAAIASGKS